MKVEIKNLSVSYIEGDHALLALDRVDLGLCEGKVTALVGESGSGKTTLGKALMGLLPSEAKAEGEIHLDDNAILGLPEQEINALRWSKIAMLFQNGASNLNPVKPILDQVAEPLVQHNYLPRKRAVQEAKNSLIQMGLDEELVKRYPHELSGGQIQRALLSMALILDPETLILDEPTAALDAMTKNFITGVISALKDKQKSILLITHDLEVAQNLADTAAVLYLGQILEILPGPDLLQQPCHPYTLALSRSYPDMEAVRDLGGIRGDAFYRIVHAHPREDGKEHEHSHVAMPGSVHQGGHAPPQGCLFLPRCTQAVEACKYGEIQFNISGNHQIRCLRGGIADLLKLEETAKAYSKVQALQSTDLTIKSGEIFCLVGETGSGKTTLAMIAAGTLKPDQGRRIFAGLDMEEWIRKDYPDLARKIGIIYQSPAEAVSHRFSVYDIVAEPLRIGKRKYSQQEIETLVLKSLSDVRLSTAPDFLQRYPHELNMGAIQRLCLARALINDPLFLIADEPTSSLDPSVQAKILKMLHSLQIEKGLSMLFVTHDIGLARKIADRIGVMLQGKMVEIGTAAQIVHHPAHPYTKMLIDSARGVINSTLSKNGKNEGQISGCPFQDRCERFQEECSSKPLEPVNLDNGQHLAWCLNPLPQNIFSA